MKILWICNIVLPDFSQEFSIKKSNAGGWMTGVLQELEQADGIEICFAFPIYDKERLRDGSHNGHNYYTYLCNIKNTSYDPEMLKTFERIFEMSKPDVIHIWGTEYYHSKAALMVCMEQGLLNRVIIDIQGLVSICARHYGAGIPLSVIKKENKRGNSILSEIEDFNRRGKNERYIFERVNHVFGRTDWDEICSYQMNPHVNYRKCNRILRKGFYECKEVWNIHTCRRFKIFVSQANYAIKGFHFLLKALPVVLERYPGTQVYIAGKNPIQAEETQELTSYGVYIRQLIEENDLMGYLHFLGNIDEQEMMKHYLSANLFVSASTIENNSNSVCEAMYLGVPVVASDVGGLSSIVRHKIDGILYPCDADYMLAGWVCNLFAHDDFTMELSQNARKAAVVRHNPEVIKKIIIEKYAEIADSANNNKN